MRVGGQTKRRKDGDEQSRLRRQGHPVARFMDAGSTRIAVKRKHQQLAACSQRFATVNRPFRRTQVSAPTAGGWFTPEEAAAALRSPPPSEETASSPLSSSPSEPLPPSAVDVVLALMRSNPCEVLGSLSPGIGVDGRISLIGQVYHSDPDPTSGATKGGKDKHDGGGYGTGEGLLRERHRRDGEEAEIRHGDKVGGSTKRFRCSVEVAWDKDEGGVFVQRFGIEPDERRPRWVHMPPKAALWTWSKLPSRSMPLLKSCAGAAPDRFVDAHARQP